jgi:hypothetical protein
MAYDANRRRAAEDAVEADPLAACVRAIMAKQTRWVGTATDLLNAVGVGGDHIAGEIADWPRNPRALAGRLRRSQAFLRTLGIEIAFKRAGREGTRIINMTSRIGCFVPTPSAPSATAGPVPSEAQNAWRSR